MGIRFTVILEPRQYDHLCAEANRSSLSMGELVRRALDRAYALDEERRQRGVELSVGVWRRPDAAVVGRRPGIRFTR
jgi:hypothetical protein